MNTKLFVRAAGTIVVISLAGLIFWQAKKHPNAPSPTSPSPTVSASATPAAISYDKPPTGWQTYASASAGFTVLYPKEWRHDSCGTMCVTFGTADPSTPHFIGISVTKQTLADVLKNAAAYQVSKDDVTISGITWTKIILKHPETGALFTSHFAARNGMVYEFGMGSQDDATAKIYGQMLSSFTFKK